MPRFILAEFNTHRMLSRNSASSRAIPFEKLVKSVEENPFIPIAWQKDHKGMQGFEYFEGDKVKMLEVDWLIARDNAISRAKVQSRFGVTKQIVNRLLEPFMYHTVIVTATEWENFFALRCPQYELNNGGTFETFRSRKEYIKRISIGAEENYWHKWTDLDWLKLNKGSAEIHMMATAEAMWDAINESTPKELKAGEWHIPFGDNIDSRQLIEVVPKPISSDGNNETLIKIATARCAGVSYTVVGADGKAEDYFKLIARHDMLAKNGHWSPFEHCCRVMNDSEYEFSFGNSVKGDYGMMHQVGWSGNFRGFIQYRKMFANENITK